MKIEYKGIWHERCEDAPFVGALISAVNCNFGCNGCFNNYLKNQMTITNTSDEIIDEICSNPFNKGIILGGLEWTLQATEAKELIENALRHKLKVILYTGFNETEFGKKFNELYSLPIYIKFGKYDINQKCDNYYFYGVRLSSKNQYIKKIKEN